MWTCTPPCFGVVYNPRPHGGPRRNTLIRSHPEPNVSRKQLDDGSILFTFGDPEQASNGHVVVPEAVQAPSAQLTKEELQAMKVVDLRNLAKEQGTTAFAKLRKDELIDLLLKQ